MPSFSFPIIPASTPTTGVTSARRVSTTATDYGSDCTTWAGTTQTTPDLDPSFRTITGQRVVAEAVCRRLCTPRGSLPDDPNAGFDIRRLVHAKMDDQTLLQLKTAIEREAEKDERVFRTRCGLTVEYGAGGGNRRSVTVTADLDVETMFGSFSLVLGVDDVSVSLLRGTQ